MEQKSTNAFGLKASKAFAPPQPEHGSRRASHHSQLLCWVRSPAWVARELTQLSAHQEAAPGAGSSSDQACAAPTISAYGSSPSAVPAPPDTYYWHSPWEAILLQFRLLLAVPVVMSQQSDLHGRDRPGPLWLTDAAARGQSAGAGVLTLSALLCFILTHANDPSPGFPNIFFSYHFLPPLRKKYLNYPNHEAHNTPQLE